MEKTTNQSPSQWLRPMTIAVASGLLANQIPQIWSFFFAQYRNLQSTQKLSLVLSLINLTLFLAVLAFEIRSFLKSYLEKRRYIKKRFGILWRYEVTKERLPDIYATWDEITGREPVPYCPKHKIKLTNFNIMQDKSNRPVLLNLICEECKNKVIQPKEKGESDTTKLTGSAAISRMRKWFRRI